MDRDRYIDLLMDRRWITLFSSDQVDVFCFSSEHVSCFSFLLLIGADSWSLLYLRHQDSTDPVNFDARGITEENFEEGAKS